MVPAFFFNYIKYNFEIILINLKLTAVLIVEGLASTSNLRWCKAGKIVALVEIAIKKFIIAEENV